MTALAACVVVLALAAVSAVAVAALRGHRVRVADDDRLVEHIRRDRPAGTDDLLLWVRLLRAWRDEAGRP